MKAQYILDADEFDILQRELEDIDASLGEITCRPTKPDWVLTRVQKMSESLHKIQSILKEE